MHAPLSHEDGRAALPSLAWHLGCHLDYESVCKHLNLDGHGSDRATCRLQLLPINSLDSPDHIVHKEPLQGPRTPAAPHALPVPCHDTGSTGCSAIIQHVGMALGAEFAACNHLHFQRKQAILAFALLSHAGTAVSWCLPPPSPSTLSVCPFAMADNTKVAEIYEASSKLAKFPFEPYWPEKKLRICVTGAGGFIARCDGIRAVTWAGEQARIKAAGRRKWPAWALRLPRPLPRAPSLL